uniref:Uncharacterized protein n=1 Tax=viral metagenome TaxID=1070528 RepID=A0A6M3IQ01_9ZZZZ
MKYKVISVKTLDTILIGMLVVLAGDLIYLFVKGAWYDVLWVEIIELSMLSMFIVVGIIRVVQRMREIRSMR